MSQTSDTAKLIDKVRLRNFLYDLSDADYKNREKKAETWIIIANEMGYESGVYWSAKWKSLRDNYNKYKKTKQSSTNPSNKKYRNWPWAEHMKFLDNYACTKTYFSSVNSSLTQDTQNGIPSARTSENSPDHEAENTQVSDSKILVKNLEIRPRRTKIKTINKKLSKKRSFDEVDLFFLSYAKNFKRLSRKSQALMKVEIASLFTRYELQDENEMDVQNPTFQNFGLFAPSVSCIYDNDNDDSN